jgi:signal peptide peptidase-like 2B
LFSKYVVDPTTTYCRILFLQDASDEIPNTKDVGVSGVVNMNAKAAVLFVLVASCFLFMLYKLMSPWFIEVLVVLFCIGGIEVLTTITSI